MTETSALHLDDFPTELKEACKELAKREGRSLAKQFPRIVQAGLDALESASQVGSTTSPSLAGHTR